MGLASQQNVGGRSRGAALAGDSGGTALDGEPGLPGRGGVPAQRPWCLLASYPYRAQATQATCRPAARTPLELCSAGAVGLSRCAVQSRGLALWQTAGGYLAGDHHGSPQTALGFCLASAGTQTGAETPCTRPCTDCGLTAPKNLYLKGVSTPRSHFPTVSGCISIFVATWTWVQFRCSRAR